MHTLQFRIFIYKFLNILARTIYVRIHVQMKNVMCQTTKQNNEQIYK